MEGKRTRYGVLIGVIALVSLVGVTMLAGTARSGSATTAATAATADYVLSPTIERVRKSNKLRACYDPEFPPEVYTNNGQPDLFLQCVQSHVHNV